ncbi:MAG: methyltransferase [Proteobacteria bacterium]|nr:MAG: methyltransferase [Pseudomonadota bacterium]
MFKLPIWIVQILAGLGIVHSANGQAPQPPASGRAELDARVEAFLEEHRGTWHDLNVPEIDGRTLHDLIVERGFRRAVEIGTSTGHSTVWIAWALSKTGGRLVTIEIDPERHRTALANLQAAGLAEFVDARLGDAHTLVPQLPGPIDFVFSDADKEWYRNYFVALWPKIEPGGCFTAHNVSMTSRGIREFLAHLETVEDGVTRIDERSRAGLSITCKRP